MFFLFKYSWKNTLDFAVLVVVDFRSEVLGFGMYSTTVCAKVGLNTTTPRANRIRDWVQAAHQRKVTNLIELVLNTVETRSV